MRWVLEEVPQAIAALRDPKTVRPQLIVLEFRNQSLDKIEMDNLMWFRIPVIALVSSAELDHPILKRHKWGTVLQRPITIGEICKQVEALLHM